MVCSETVEMPLKSPYKIRNGIVVIDYFLGDYFIPLFKHVF